MQDYYTRENLRYRNRLQFDPGGSDTFRHMHADRDSLCPYCNKRLQIGEVIWGSYGVRWGHQECVFNAFENYALIPSAANAFRRPEELKQRLRKSKRPEDAHSLLAVKEIARDHSAEIPDYYTHLEKMEDAGDEVVGRYVNQVKGVDMNTWNEIHGPQYLQKPSPSKETIMSSFNTIKIHQVLPDQIANPCPYFAPIHITTLHLPQALRLNSKMILMDMKNESLNSKTEKIQRMWDVTWEKYIKQWFERYKRTMVRAPFCPVHQLSHDPKDHVQLHVQSIGALVHYKELWWCCPKNEKPK